KVVDISLEIADEEVAVSVGVRRVRSGATGGLIGDRSMRHGLVIRADDRATDGGLLHSFVLLIGLHGCYHRQKQHENRQNDESTSHMHLRLAVPSVFQCKAGVHRECGASANVLGEKPA